VREILIRLTAFAALHNRKRRFGPSVPIQTGRPNGMKIACFHAMTRLGRWLAMAAIGALIFSAAADLPAAIPFTPVIQTSRDASCEVVSDWMAEGAASLHFNFNALSSPISENASLTYTGAPLGAGSAAFHRVSEPTAFTVLYPPGAFAISATNATRLNIAGARAFSDRSSAAVAWRCFNSF
jgi:hypothetical protein